jgi:hypothetical protein
MRPLPLLLTALLLSGCGATAPGPLRDLDGTWVASAVESSVSISLVQLGEVVSGSGEYHRFVNPPNGTITVTGAYAHGTATLTLQYDTGVVTRFVGLLPNPGHLVGIETGPGGLADTLSFAKQ